MNTLLNDKQGHANLGLDVEIVAAIKEHILCNISEVFEDLECRKRALKIIDTGSKDAMKNHNVGRFTTFLNFQLKFQSKI